jgi:hypothetical protein
MPRDTNRPNEELMAVCGQCVPAASQYRVIPAKITVSLSPWVETNRKTPITINETHDKNHRLPRSDKQYEGFMALRDRVLLRDARVCQYCGLTGQMIDKINRFKKFDVEENWVCCCKQCRDVALHLHAETRGQKRDMILERRGIELKTTEWTDRKANHQMRRRWDRDRNG